MRSLILLFIAITIRGYAQNSEADFERMPAIAWKFRTPMPIFSSPVIDEGVVYFGGLDSTLYALDLSSGNLRWKVKTNGEIRSTVVVQGKWLYLAGGNGVFSCIDKASGKPEWRVVYDNMALFMAERRYDFADYYHSTPLIQDEVIYLGTGNGRMQALNAHNGNVIWSFQAGDIIHNTPAIAGDIIYFGCFEGYVYALDIRSGVLRWKFKSIGHQYFPHGEMQGSPVAGFGSVFIGSRDYNLYALNPGAGYANWHRKFSAGWALSATLKDTVVYVGASDDRVLLALDARDGQERWRADVKFNIFGGCAFSPRMVFVGSIWGKLFGIDRITGKIRWAFATDGYTTNRRNYFKDDDTFRDDIGSVLRAPVDWIKAEYRMGGIFSTPAVHDGRLVITTTEGLVYCLKKM